MYSASPVIRTQIGGYTSDDLPYVLELKRKVEAAGVSVSCPQCAVPTALKKSQSTHSMKDLSLYLAIADSNFHIIHNSSPVGIDEPASQEILYAMLKRKPIVLLHVPLFEESVSPLARDMTLRHLDKIIVSDLTQLDQGDLKGLLHNIARQSVANYSMTNREIQLITLTLQSALKISRSSPFALCNEEVTRFLNDCNWRGS